MTDKSEFNPTLVSCAEDMSTCTLTLGDGRGYFYNRVDADPVPPAGGEPEMLQAVEDAMWGCFRDGAKEYRGCTKERVEETRSLIRARVTRLQAEVGKAIRNGHEWRSSFYKQQSELTKARELLAVDQRDAERWRFFSEVANELQAFPHSWGEDDSRKDEPHVRRSHGRSQPIRASRQGHTGRARGTAESGNSHVAGPGRP